MIAVKYAFLSFGLVLKIGDNNAICDEAYVLPLDSASVQYKELERLYNTHKHIALPLVKRETYDQLTEELKRNYDTIISLHKE